MSYFESFNLAVSILTLSRTNGLGSFYDLYARQNYVAYPRRFGLTNYLVFPKKRNPLYQIVGKFD